MGAMDSKVTTIVLSKRANGRFVREYAFLQFMDCTKPLDSIDRELGCVCLR